MNDEHDDDELPVKLAHGVELIGYVEEHEQSFAILEEYELLTVFQEVLAKINAEIEACPEVPAVFVDILPCRAERLLFAVTLIYTGGETFRGSLAVAKYSGPLRSARKVCFLSFASAMRSLN